MRQLWRFFMRWRARRVEAARWRRAAAERTALDRMREANRAADLAALCAGRSQDYNFRRGVNGPAPQHPGFKGLFPHGCGPDYRRDTGALLDACARHDQAGPSRVDSIQWCNPGPFWEAERRN